METPVRRTGNKFTSETPWVQNAVKMAVSSAKETMGTGWRVLSPEMRRMAVCEELVVHFSSLDAESVSVDTGLRMIITASTIMEMEF